MSATSVVEEQFTDFELGEFQLDGFVIVRDLIPETYRSRILAVTHRDATSHFGDIEYEADLNYPGAPVSRDAAGGRTIRRLRQAFSRDPVFSELVKEHFLLNRLKQLLGPQVVMPLSHHNCIMTKHPQFSSDTGWHQDIRYWSFTSPELVNVWMALGSETVTNGCLRLLPGTHRLPIRRDQLHDDLFLRDDLNDNQKWLQSAVVAELQPGDVLFFHARSFHSATRNYSNETKYSAVFTFRSMDNLPLPETRSAALPELLLL